MRRVASPGKMNGPLYTDGHQSGTFHVQCHGTDRRVTSRHHVHNNNNDNNNHDDDNDSDIEFCNPRFFLQSLYSSADCLQHFVCKSRATHRALIIIMQHVLCHVIRRGSSAIKFGRVESHLL